jgi:hypothetical protein
MLIELTSTPSDGATDWMMANWPTPAGMAGSRRTAARVTLGANDDIRRERDQFVCVSANFAGLAPGPPNFDPYIAALGPAQLLQRLLKCHEVVSLTRIVRVYVEEHSDTAHALGLLRLRRVRPSGCRRAAKKTDELAPSHCLPRGSRQGIVSFQTSTL